MSHGTTARGWACHRAWTTAPSQVLWVFTAGPRLLVSQLSRPVLLAVHGPTVPDGAAPAGPRLVRRLHDLRTAEQPTWAWPLPGGRASGAASHAR